MWHHIAHLSTIRCSAGLGRKWTLSFLVIWCRPLGWTRYPDELLVLWSWARCPHVNLSKIEIIFACWSLERGTSPPILKLTCFCALKIINIVLKSNILGVLSFSRFINRNHILTVLIHNFNTLSFFITVLYLIRSWLFCERAKSTLSFG